MLLAALFGDPASALHAERLNITLTPDSACPEADALVTALESRLSPLRVENASSESARYQLDVARRDSHQLFFELRDRGSVLATRTLDVAPGECAAVADTLALIAAAWIHGPPLSDATPRADSPLPDAALPEVSSDPEPSAAASSGSTPLDVTGPASQQSPRDAPPPRAAASEGRDSADASDSHLALELAGGTAFAFESGSAPVALARAGVEVAHGRWLFGLRGLAETAEAVGEDESVSVRHTSADLSVGWLLVHGGAPDVALLVGGGIDVVTASTKAYVNTDLDPAVSPIVAFALRGAWPLSPRFALFTGAELVVCLRRERFVSEGQLIASTPRTRARLVLGASWNLF